MSKLDLSVACGDDDRARPLHDGRVGLEGSTWPPLPQPPGETSFRASRRAEFDFAELSVGTTRRAWRASRPGDGQVQRPVARRAAAADPRRASYGFDRARASLRVQRDEGEDGLRHLLGLLARASPAPRRDADPH